MSQHKRISNVWIAGDLRMVISARHLIATRANLRIAHERQQEKALWEEEHGSCRKCDHDNNPNPQARCNGCINGGGKLDLYKKKQKKRKPVPKMVRCARSPGKLQEGMGIMTAGSALLTQGWETKQKLEIQPEKEKACMEG